MLSRIHICTKSWLQDDMFRYLSSAATSLVQPLLYPLLILNFNISIVVSIIIKVQNHIHVH